MVISVSCCRQFKQSDKHKRVKFKRVFSDKLSFLHTNSVYCVDSVDLQMLFLNTELLKHASLESQWHSPVVYPVLMADPLV